MCNEHPATCDTAPAPEYVATPENVTKYNTMTMGEAAFKIAHTADWHLRKNSRYQGKQNLRECIDSLVTQSLEAEVDLFMVTGDVFDNGNPSTDDLDFAMSKFQELMNNGVPVVYEDGNHGHHGVQLGSRYAGDVMRRIGVHVYDEAPAVMNIETRSGDIAVLGVPWAERALVAARAGLEDVEHDVLDDAIAEVLSDEIADAVDAANLPSGTPLVIGAHATISNANIVHGAEQIINPRGVYGDIIQELESYLQVNPAYCALGHIHHAQCGERWSYAGSVQEQTFGEDGTTKGGWLVGFNATGGLVRELMPTPTRHLINVRLGAGQAAADEAVERVRPGDRVKVFLAPGELDVPSAVREAVTVRGGLIERVVKAPVEREANAVVMDESLSLMDQVSLYLDVHGKKLSKTRRAAVEKRLAAALTD